MGYMASNNRFEIFLKVKDSGRCLLGSLCLYLKLARAHTAMRAGEWYSWIHVTGVDVRNLFIQFIYRLSKYLAVQFNIASCMQ
jgi:hypothetical protein